MDKSRHLPSNLDAERALLGAILRDESRTAIERIRKELEPDALYLREHQLIYKALLVADGDHGRAVDALRVFGLLEDAGGAEYVTELHAMVHLSENAKYHAELVRDAWRRRELVEFAGSIVGAAMDAETPLMCAVDYIRDRTREIAAWSTSKMNEPQQPFVFRTLASER